MLAYELVNISGPSINYPTERLSSKTRTCRRTPMCRATN